jgi:NADH-quinone oxidoreductase subunit G
VPFYAGLTLEEIGGRGVRWQEREAAATFPARLGSPDVQTAGESPADAAHADGGLRLGSFRSIWASPEVENSPALKFLTPRQRVEMAPADAERLGLRDGQRVEVAQNGHAVGATVALRQAAPAGTVFLQDGLAQDSANELAAAVVEVRPA